MAVINLDHVNIRSADPKATLDFFQDVLGMKVGPPPGAATMDGGGWVYDPLERAVLHVGGLSTRYSTDETMPFPEGRGGGAVHHVALGCTDLEEMRHRLQALNVSFSENDLSRLGLRQIFVREPNGVLLELNFRV